MAGPTHPPAPGQQPLPEAAIAALHLGNKLEAIKIVREAAGLGLKEAKDLVEAYVAGQPQLASKFNNEIRVTARGCILFVLAMLAMAFGLFQFMSRKG